MGNFFFWLFTLAYSLLIPGSMLLLGRSFANNPPGEINGGYGYRTARSMRNRETWAFAQRYSGRFWVRAGQPVLAVSLVWMALLFGRGIAKVGYSGMILTGLQLVPFLAVIPATERALKREFDDFGEKR
ncbi:MAG: SdpI family protein [Oscillibacter sp.]|nr:SdpI family protein [Oscillibacter sp.]